MPGRVLPDQPGPHHRTIGVDDPAARRPDGAVVGVGVGEHLVPVEHRGAPAHPGLGQCGRPQTGLPHRAAGRGHLDLAVEAQPADGVEVDARGALHRGGPAAEGGEHLVQRRGVGARVEPAVPAAAARRVEQDHGVAGDRAQRVGAEQRHAANVVAGHRQPHLVEVAAEDLDGGGAQRRELGADRAGGVVHDGTGQPPGPVLRHRRGGGLLQRLVGEQPAGHVGEPGELHRGPAPQQGGLHQRGGALAEAIPDRGDVGEPAGLGQRVAGDLAQRGGAGVTGQVGDVGAPERQDGLTPVSITL